MDCFWLFLFHFTKKFWECGFIWWVFFSPYMSFTKRIPIKALVHGLWNTVFVFIAQPHTHMFSTQTSNMNIKQTGLTLTHTGTFFFFFYSDKNNFSRRRQWFIEMCVGEVEYKTTKAPHVYPPSVISPWQDRYHLARNILKSWIYIIFNTVTFCSGSRWIWAADL